MSATQFLVPQGALAAADRGDEVALDGEEGRHAASVQRLRAGEPIVLADGHGTRVSGVVATVDKRSLTMRVQERSDEPAPSPRFVLVQALAKGGRDEQAIEAATELGVDVVVPWQAERSVVRWRDERADRGIARWKAVVAAATKQSRRAWLPEVRPALTTDGLRALVSSAARAFVLHETAADPLAGQRLPDSGDVVLVVGPEGGISAGELDVLSDAGGRVVRLGHSVLRASTAGPAAIAVLSAARRWT